jgi:hypothetical protein
MDRRLIERHQTGLDAMVTDIASQKLVGSGAIVDISQAGLCVELPARMSEGALVKVQIGDCALFGHVTYCFGEDSFRTGIEVVRVLIGESDLARLVNSILAEQMPALPGVRVS